MPEYDPRIGEIADAVEREWKMYGLTDNLYEEFAAEVAIRYAAEQAHALAARGGERPGADVDVMVNELYDVAFALNMGLPSLDALPRDTQLWLRDRAMRLVKEDGWTRIPPPDEGKEAEGAVTRRVVKGTGVPGGLDRKAVARSIREMKKQDELDLERAPWLKDTDE